MTFVKVLALLYLKSLAKFLGHCPFLQYKLLCYEDKGHAYRYVQFHQLRPYIKRIREQKLEGKERGLRH
jgi:hypothetical protein